MREKLSFLATYKTGNGVKENKLFSGCEIITVHSHCMCGFSRYTRKGHFSFRQIEEMRCHLESNTTHTFTVTYEFEAEKLTTYPS